MIRIRNQFLRANQFANESVMLQTLFALNVSVLADNEFKELSNAHDFKSMLHKLATAKKYNFILYAVINVTFFFRLFNNKINFTQLL